MLSTEHLHLWNPLHRTFDAVLFDWCGTLVEYPTKQERFRPILQRLGRPHDATAVSKLAAAYRAAEEHPDVIKADERCDLSAADHAATKLLIGKRAGIDDELAGAIERSYGDLTSYRRYPEAVDVITTLHRNGIEVAIVSDFHVDLRPHFESLGILGCIAGFAISFEVGVTKPHRLMFETALAKTSAQPERCLMVGDNPKPDCGAAELGIATLILPFTRPPRPPLLERVTALVLSSP
jgi:HAD superfamily hydrolase (TIGR01509 family)